MEHKFLVGFGDVVITPQEPVPLGGCSFDSSTRFFNNIFEDVHAISVAMTDEQGGSLLLVTMDLVRAYNQVVAAVRQELSKHTGLPQERIVVTCTHTHSAPDLINQKEPSIARYEPVLIQKVIEAGLLAWADRKPATMSVGKIQAPGLNHVKHYKHTTEEGVVKYFGDNFGIPVYDETTCHASDADPTLRLIRFRREGGKDVILANFQAHPQLTGGAKNYNLSADYPGAFREILGAQLDCHVHFLQGACGNINPKSRLKRENYTVDHRAYGARLSYFAIKCLEDNMKDAEPGPIKSKQIIYRGKINHTLDYLQDRAREILDLYEKTKDRELCIRAGAAYGIDSPNMATFILIKARAGEYIDLELNAFALGEHLALVTAPNELFDTNAVYTEEHSPFDLTMTCGYANGHYFYIPSKYGYEYRCYESHCSRMFPGTGEKYSELFLEMLEELKNS